MNVLQIQAISGLGVKDLQAEGSNQTSRDERERVSRFAVFARWWFVQTTLFGALLVWGLDRLRLRRAWMWITGRSERYAPITGPKALRLAFERLGPTFIKLGQLIASGDGLFPQRYSEEFRSCLDDVPPFRSDEVRRIVEDELGRSIETAFASFDERPVAAASIAQVHFATLPDGSEVAVKVQRPGLGPIIAKDLRVMALYARFLRRFVPLADLANPVGIVEDLAATLREELDFRKEGRNMDEFNAIMRLASNEAVSAPKVDWDRSSARVLTMERFAGVSVDDTETLLAGPIDPMAGLLSGIRAWFQCLLYRGFFHGDVHAGNFMVLDDGRIGFLDFGIVGRLDQTKRNLITQYVMAFQTRDFEALGDVLIQMGSVDATRIDRKQFGSELRDAFAPMLDPEDGYRMRDVVPGMLRVAVRHRMRMPREFVLITKQLVYLDRYAKAYGGPSMNVLTEPRVLAFLMEDMAAAALATD